MSSRMDASHFRIAVVVWSVSSFLEATVVVHWHLLLLFFFGLIIFLSFSIANARGLIVFSEFELSKVIENETFEVSGLLIDVSLMGCH
jgi:hypothetical protein